MSHALGIRLASRFFFGQSCDWLVGELGLSQSTSLFPFSTVIQLISKTYCADKPLVMTIQFDEFGVVPEPLLDDVQDKCLDKSRVWLLPYLTGTTVSIGINSITSSKITPKGIPLCPLDSSASMSSVHAAIDQAIAKATKEGESLDRANIKGLSELKGTIKLRMAVECLGYNPRNLQLFTMSLTRGMDGASTFSFQMFCVLRCC
jgi:hypothetical protein